MSLMPPGDWIGATEAGKLARVHRRVVIQAIRTGELPAFVKQHKERKRILIQREDARRWAASLPPPARNMPTAYPRLSAAQFLATVLALHDAGRVRSAEWIAPVYCVLCEGQGVTAAARQAGFVPSGLSGVLARMVKAAAELPPQAVEHAGALIGSAALSAAGLATLAEREAKARKTARQTARRAAWAAAKNISALNVLETR